MRKLLAALLIFLAVPSFAQTYGSTKATMTLRKMFVQNGWFGFPPSAADPFTCNAFTERSAYWNTTSHVAKWCDATAWRTVTTSAALAPLSCDGTNCTIDGGGLILSGNISAAAWTTNGIKLRGAPGTLTDTSSSGTVAAAYTNVLGGNTIAASSATVFTDYYTMYLKQPVAGSNVTLTNRWSLGTEGGAYFGAGVTLGSGQLLLPAGTESLPSMSFMGDPDTGFYNAAANNLNATVGGTKRWVWTVAGYLPSATGTYTLGAAGNRIAAGYFGGQTLTTTVTPLWDGSVTWNGSGTTHRLIYGNVTDTASAAGSTLMDLQVGSVSKLSVTKAGTVNAAGSVISASSLQFGTSGALANAARGSLSFPADGVIALWNAAGTDFSRLQLGGTTSSFPAIKRNGAAINFRLADDSADAAITAGQITSSGSINAASSSAIGWQGAGKALMASSADGVINFYNAAVTDFGRITLGGTTSSFPAIKRSGAAITTRLADDSADTYLLQSGIYGSLYETGGSTAITITTAGTYYQWVNSTAGACTNMTCATATDDITATIAGKYRVTAVTSFVSGTNNETITGRIFNEGSGQTQCTSAKKLATAANMNDISISCIVTMAVNDSLTLMFTSTSSSTSVTPSEVNISASYLGN